MTASRSEIPNSRPRFSRRWKNRALFGTNLSFSRCIMSVISEKVVCKCIQYQNSLILRNRQFHSPCLTPTGAYFKSHLCGIVWISIWKRVKVQISRSPRKSEQRYWKLYRQYFFMPNNFFSDAMCVFCYLCRNIMIILL